MQDVSKKTKSRIGEILLDYGLITQEQLSRALDRQIQNGKRLGSMLEDMGYLDIDTLLSILGKQFDLPFINLFEVKVPPDILGLLPFEQVKSFKILPFRKTGESVSLAMVDPANVDAIQNAEFITGKTVKPFIVPHYQMDKAISRFEKDGYGDLLFEGEKLKQEKIHVDSMIPNVYTLLKLLIDFKATDLHLAAGAPPSIKVTNELKRLSMPYITPAQMKDFTAEILSKEQMEEFKREKEIDFVLSLSDTGRFRINIYKQRNSISISARLIFEDIPSLEDLSLPEWIIEYVLKQQGLILIVGLAGHGKTTTMSSLINVINTNRRCNIVTLEDPVEYLHRHNKCNVNQREIGIDTDSFAAGLRHIMRQGPDVIGVGDLRDTESISIALNAAESGHLVIGTMNSLNIISAVEKIINIFPDHQRPLIRMQLADTLLLVFAQKLIPGKDDSGRVLACGKLINSSRVAGLMREGKTSNLRSLMQGVSEDVLSVDQGIANLFMAGKIDFEDGMKFADNPEYYRELSRMGRE